MPWVGFEPTIPALKRAKTVHALDRASTVIGKLQLLTINLDTELDREWQHIFFLSSSP
jgi:hypothetical protein